MINLGNTSRETLDSCERKYYYRYILHKVLKEPKSMAPWYGVSLHKAFKEIHKKSSRDRVLKAFGEEYAKYYDGKDEDRTVGNAIIIIDEFTKRFEDDYLETKELEISGSIVIAGEGIEVAYYSRIDRIALWKNENKLVIEDWKTSRYVGASYNILRPNNQFRGYALTVKELRGENLEFFVTLVSTKVKKRVRENEERVEIVRDYTKYSQLEFEEFKLGLIETGLRVKRCMETNYWPQRTHSCGNYGGCEYLELCKAETKHSEVGLIDILYKDYEWQGEEERDD